MNLNATFIHVTIPPSQKRQTTTTVFQADISTDTLNEISAADAVRTLHANFDAVKSQLTEVLSLTLVPLASTSSLYEKNLQHLTCTYSDELGEGVIAPIEPESPRK